MRSLNMALRQGSNRGDSSHIWKAAIDRYYEELRKGGVKAPTIDKEVWSIQTPDDLLKHIQNLTPTSSSTSVSWMSSLSRLKSILLTLNDFAAVLTLALGMNSQMAAVLWGSIRLILKWAQPVLPELLDMLEDLSRALPRFRKYEQELPMTPALETALLDTYTEIIIFCAHSIAFFRNNPNLAFSKNAWSKFSSDFPTVISNIRRYSRVVNETADMIRLTREAQNVDTIEAIKNLQLSQPKELKLPCYMIPYGLNLRFFGRSQEKRMLEESLDPQANCDSLSVIAIHGTGGVGKTQLALHYANTFIKRYDVVVWIPAETQIKFIQAVAKLATKLEIPMTQGGEDDYQCVVKVKDWLNTSGKTFLLIFDNGEDNSIIEQIWPATTTGSVIITCRSQSLASKRTTKVIHLECFTPETGIEVLYSLTGLQPSSKDDAAAAHELLKLLDGYSYEELLPVYKRSAEKIFARSSAPMQYEHTLGTVWEVSFQSLSTESRSLLNILAFFDPDTIQEWILCNDKAGVADPLFEFLFDEFDFGDALIGLTKASLVTRLPSRKALSIHRLVQFTIFQRLMTAERIVYLDFAVRVLYYSFPNTWNDRNNQQGHSWASWETCSSILPHVSWLIRLTDKHGMKPKDPELFAELIFRTATYLWEKEQPITARSFFESGMRLDINKSTKAYAQACRLLGHIALDLARPQAALTAYLKALEVRQVLEEPNSPPIADIYDSIACSYTEQGHVTEAFEYLAKAEAIHNAHDSRNMARTLAIFAMAYFRAGQPDQALVALDKCWQLQGLSEEHIILSRYPKHSGDIVLLSRIKFAQGMKQDARELASRTITIRRGLFGDKGVRVVDSMFIVARMLESDGEEVIAAKLLRSIIEIGQEVSGMQGHLARALWFLAKIEGKMGDQNRAHQLRSEAIDARDKISDLEPSPFVKDSDESFMTLVGWMLW
ncbi:TPR-like protein [Aspergillus sclerotiicarbonarius CBS 121057]|uniref:TPR-like protein n=1 Tax=Aspergillus sclerotiicarbonarius (strain CBS 121057 / IBT 28362) TaxID=1448318 RepID=A0A319F2H1_ASPSB|nr:TPR-like protein [Aspergillus sclerotiicarbonarius CBS 121057]